MSVCIHAYFLLVALLQAGLDRYALVVWPLQIAVAGIAGIWLLDRWLDRAR